MLGPSSPGGPGGPRAGELPWARPRPLLPALHRRWGSSLLGSPSHLQRFSPPAFPQDHDPALLFRAKGPLQRLAATLGFAFLLWEGGLTNPSGLGGQLPSAAAGPSPPATTGLDSSGLRGGLHSRGPEPS